MVSSGVTKEEVIGWGGVEVFNQAITLCNTDAIEDVRYDDDTLVISGKVKMSSDDWKTPVSLKLLPGGSIRSMCPCDTTQRYGRVCPHVVALGLALSVMEAEAAEAEQAQTAAAKAKSSTPSELPADPEQDYIEVPIKPRVFAYVRGSRASLSVEVDVQYGNDIRFPACSFQSPRTVWLPDADDPLVRRVRCLSAEREAVEALKEWGFHPGYKEGDVKFYTTDQQGVLDFLGAGLPELRRHSWRIELSDDLERLTDQMPSVVPVVTIRDAPGGAFDVHYTFDLGGESVSPVEIQAALNRGDGYILRDGKVILLDRLGIESLHNVFGDCSLSQANAPKGWFRVKSAYAGYVKSSLDLVDCEINAGKAKFWRQIAERQNKGCNAKFGRVALGQLETVLRPYQKQGVYWMRFLENAGMSGLLADEMGLGKTLQTLAWLNLTRSDPLAHDDQGRNLPALVICPTSLVRNWEAEAQKFTPWLNTLVISGPNRAADFEKIQSADLVITSYALMQRDFDDAYVGRHFSVAVLDEAQHIKNRQTRNARAVKGIEAVQRLVLTGTPIENSVADVWSIFDFLMPDYLGEYESFKLDYETPIIDGENAEATLSRLKRKIQPFILRREKKTVAKDLPDKIVKVSYCPMSDDSQREYTQALANARLQAGQMIRAKGFQKSKFELLALLMKLRQIAARAKLEPFMEQLADAIRGGHKILVFSQFVKMLKLIEERLIQDGIAYCYLDGSTKDRLGQCNQFNRSPQIPVFLISLMAGGTGLNLTGADMVMHYDPWWNPAVEDQATDRAHRIGQKKSVYVIKMIASGSVEEKVLALQRRKQAVINATVNTTDTAVMEKLTAADLNELLS